MALEIPKPLLHLDANCGVFSVWMVLYHHGIKMDVAEIAKACQHDPEDGTFTIALAVALKKMGFHVDFYSDPDPNIDASEALIYQQAKKMNIQLHDALSYAEIQNIIAQGKLVIVAYDQLDGVAHQSLIHSINHEEVCFFDSFEAMPADVFDQQRSAEGICRQAIVIDDQEVEIRSIKVS